MYASFKYTKLAEALERRIVKRRGEVKITYEMLAALLGLELGSIINIYLEPQCEIMHIVHQDSKYAYDIVEGQHHPESAKPLEKYTHVEDTGKNEETTS